jgi:hypothetical protein
MVHTWSVTGWYEVDPGRCETIIRDSGGEPIYVAIAFTDFVGNWGAFVPDKRDRGDAVFHPAKINLCIVRGRKFDYTRGGSDPGGPCKEGYYPFPAAVYVTPTASRGTNTYEFIINKNDAAMPVRQPEGGSNATDGSASPSPGGSAGKAVGTAVGIGAAIIIGKAIVDALDARPDAERAPAPFDAGTLNAVLLDKPIVRRVSGAGVWYYGDGSRVNPVYQLDGRTESDLFDAPAQRETSDSEVAAAQEDLVRALDSYQMNRVTLVTGTGRLYYSFVDAHGVLHSSLTNLAALDFPNAKGLGDLGGVTGYAIPCRNQGACTIGVDKDPDGKLGNNHIYSSINLYFATSDDGPAVWGALLRLRGLYPAEPAVTAR